MVCERCVNISLTAVCYTGQQSGEFHNTQNTPTNQGRQDEMRAQRRRRVCDQESSSPDTWESVESGWIEIAGSDPRLRPPCIMINQCHILILLARERVNDRIGRPIARPPTQHRCCQSFAYLSGERSAEIISYGFLTLSYIT